MAVTLLALPARAGDAMAEDFVRALAADFASAGAVAPSDPAAARAAVLSILAAAFDMRSMAISALPEGFRDRADASYVAAYTGYVADSFVSETLNGGEGRTEILGSRVQSDSLTLVGTRVVAEGQPSRSVEWYLTPAAPGFRVVNAAVSGVLITAEQARDFQPVLIAGDMPGLIHHLAAAAVE
jgi:ABC-type transporter MlaC component